VALQIARMKEQRAEAAAAAPEEATPERRFAAKRAAVGMLVSLTRHSAALAGAAVEQGGLEAAIACLAEVDAEVKEGAGVLVWRMVWGRQMVLSGVTGS